MRFGSPHRVFVFLTIFSEEGGIQNYSKTLLQAYVSLFPAAGSAVFLLRDSPVSDNPLQSDSLTFHYFQAASAGRERSQLALSLLRFLLQHRPQQVICGHVNLAPLIQLLCQPLGIPYLVITHGKEVWQPLPLLQRIALHKAQSIWTVSRYTRTHLCASNGIPPEPVKILPNVVDGDRFTPATKPLTLLIKYGTGDAKVLMTVARLWSGDIYKGVDVTIRALPKIRQFYPDVKYLVIGRGDDQPRLAQLAEELGVKEQVIFAGFVPDEALAEHYRLADAYIMPSQEGFGIVYLEAMACGIPVLAGDADGSADPLQDGRLGWRVPHRDPEAVAKACIEMLRGDDRRCNGRWLREQTLIHFGRDAFAQRLKTLLE
jgi:glycosyltransferase involved in cell wall biosynthesis